MYKSFGQFLFESSESAEERKKDKDMADKLKAAKEAEAKAKSELEKTIKGEDVSSEDIKKAKLVSAKTGAEVTKLDAEIKLKAMEDGSNEKKDNGKS